MLLTPIRTGGWTRRGMAAAIIAFVVAGSAACSGVEPATPDNGRGDEFRFAISAQPTLNPYLADGNPYNAWVLGLAYEPLIRRQADLSYAGGLAESFRYTDKENKAFVVTLRPGMTFADGSTLDAAAVVASLRYFLQVGLNAKTWGGTIAEVSTTGPLEVTITSRVPNPEVPWLLSQDSFAGFVISPAGLANPDQLGQHTFGAGPYVLDVAATKLNSRYVFKPNPHYHDAPAVHWNSVVAQVIADPSSSVKALAAGQVDYIGSAVNLLPEIEAAGMVYRLAPAGVVGVSLADRDGTVAPALKDQRVRQALNLAIDRKAILQAIFAGNGSPTNLLNSPGWEGYYPDSGQRYPYDPEQAKRLLAEAGYPGGFAVSMLAQQFIGQVAVAQAVAAQWEKIGVRATITTVTQIPQAITEGMSRKYAVLPLLALNSSAYLLSQSYLLPLPNPANPFGTNDAQLSSMLTQAAAISDPQQRLAAYRQAMARLVDLAWFAPVVTIPGVAAASKKVTGWENEANRFDIRSIRPA